MYMDNEGQSMCISDSSNLFLYCHISISYQQFYLSLGIEHKLTDEGFLKRFLRAGIENVFSV